MIRFLLSAAIALVVAQPAWADGQWTACPDSPQQYAIGFYGTGLDLPCKQLDVSEIGGSVQGTMLVGTSSGNARASNAPTLGRAGINFGSLGLSSGYVGGNTVFLNNNNDGFNDYQLSLPPDHRADHSGYLFGDIPLPQNNFEAQGAWGITQGNPPIMLTHLYETSSQIGVGTGTAHGLSTDDSVLIATTLGGMLGLSGGRQVTVTGSSDFYIAGSSWNAGTVAPHLGGTPVAVVELIDDSDLVELTTGSPHGFSTGNQVDWQQGLAGISTTFTVTVIDTTHFTIDGSSWSNPYIRRLPTIPVFCGAYTAGHLIAINADGCLVDSGHS